MTIAEQIYALVRTLPPEQASEGLNFAEFIRAKYLNANSPSETIASVSWAELVNSLSGAWATVYTQVDRSPTTDADRGDPVSGLIVDRSTSVKTR